MPSLQPGLELQMLPLNYVASLNEKIAWPNSLLLLTYRGGGNIALEEAPKHFVFNYGKSTIVVEFLSAVGASRNRGVVEEFNGTSSKPEKTN